MSSKSNQRPWLAHREDSKPDWDFATRFWRFFPASPGEQFDLAQVSERRLHYWRQLAAVYLAALNEPLAGVPSVSASIECWPETDAEHQAALTALLMTGKLAAPWRVQSAARPETVVQAEALEAAHRDGSRPLVEIPLYSGMFRCTCQQLVCLPFEQWRGLDDPSIAYTPMKVDTGIVASLGARIAHAFNTPPQNKERVWDCCGFGREPIVWSTSLRALTESVGAHGIHVSPNGRLHGYYGCLNVTLAQGEIWRIVVLAPNHFIDRLMWLGEEAVQSTSSTPLPDIT